MVGPGAPYVTPLMLQTAPTGIAWSTIGATSRTAPGAAENTAAVLDICHRASAQVDGYCNQPLRSTIDSETLSGPGEFRLQILPSGVARLLLSRSPITQVLSGQYCPAATFPRTWTTLPANQWDIEQPLIGVYGTTAPGGSGDGGQAVLLAPGHVSWAFGRSNMRVQVTYINGWPHAATTQTANAGDTTLHVDDCTGWGPPSGSTTGAYGIVYDAGQQESVSVTASSATSGPGMLTLSAPLSYGHADGTLVSTLPGSVIWATILYCTAEALTRGATATTVQALPGSSTGPGKASEDLQVAAEVELHPYRRVI